ncbi:MAG: ribbon-helix-helix domain-containing protein [Baekduia sp.]
MRVTVTIDEQLHAEVKIAAAQRGQSVSSFVEDALRAWLREWNEENSLVTRSTVNGVD